MIITLYFYIDEFSQESILLHIFSDNKNTSSTKVNLNHKHSTIWLIFYFSVSLPLKSLILKLVTRLFCQNLENI